MDTVTKPAEAPARQRSFRDRLRASKEKLLSNRSMMVLGCVLIGQGIYALRVGLEGELDRIETDRTFARETRERVFSIETVLEAEGIVNAAKASDEPAEGAGETETTAPQGEGDTADEGTEAGTSETNASEVSGDGDEKADLSGDEWQNEDENPTDRSQMPGTDIPA